MSFPGREMRVSDTDRQAAADRLRTALNEGRLPVAEYDNRLGQLYQAVTYADIANLFVDLPSGPPPMPPPPMPQPPLYPQGPPNMMRGPVPPDSSAATAAMVCGIVGLVAFWAPFVNLICAVLGVVLGIIGIQQTNSGRYKGRGRAIAGLVCGSIGLLAAVLVILLLLMAALFI